MIYLIDDKKQRQEGYGWNDLKFDKFKHCLRPIYNYDQIIDEDLREKIFSPGSIVLFHESFFDTANNKHEKDSLEIRVELEKYAKRFGDFSLAFFSGSKNSRSNENNVINLPVGVLYKNLEVFIEKYSKGMNNLRYLLFGENPEIEEYLSQSYDQANKNLDNLSNYDSELTSLYIRTHQNFIQKPLQVFDQETLFSIHEISDSDLSELILDWLNKKNYDNIFIPLCFGPVLSDFNGLRLALHIRTTSTLNQYANIFIYGTVDHSFLLQNEYFDVLKTKNVRLIDYKRSCFKDALFLNLSQFKLDELAGEMERITLNPPGNYFDKHSIANVWGVYQLARNANIKIEEVTGFESEKLNDIYFKWLITKNNLGLSISEEQKIEQLKYAEKLQGVKVLGKIDLTKIKRK